MKYQVNILFELDMKVINKIPDRRVLCIINFCGSYWG